MDKEFSINNLVSECKDNPIVSRELDVNLIAESDKKQKKEQNSNMLVKTILERKKKMMDLYDQIYDLCWDLILKENDNRKTDIVFNVLSIANGIPEYDSYECLLLIRNKLWKQNINATIISRTQIFISWKNIVESLFSKT